MAKKQTRRSISVSRTTYERLKAFCETNHISMSQLVETRVNDFLGPNDALRLDASVMSTASGGGPASTMTAAVSAPRPPAVASMHSAMASTASTNSTTSTGSTASRAPLPSRPVEARPAGTGAAGAGGGSAAAAAPVTPPMTSAAARFAVDPPPPIIKPRQETAAPKPAEKRPDQIFTF